MIQVSFNKLLCIRDRDHTSFADVVTTANPNRLGATELGAGKGVPIDDNYLFVPQRSRPDHCEQHLPS